VSIDTYHWRPKCLL